MNKREIGAGAEALAAEYLINSGVLILERNYRSHRGEIDLIGKHGGYLVFFEVKYRATDKKGSPEAAVGIAKQKVICKVADYYRYSHGIRQSVPVRYDVIAVLGKEIRWYQNAFLHRY